MDAAIVEVQRAPAREVVRDHRGSIVGTIERQQLVGRLIARDRQGHVVGLYEGRSRTTRDAHGRIVGQSNLLPVLLFPRR